MAATRDLGALVMWQRSDLKRISRIVILPFLAAAFLLVIGIRMAVLDQQGGGHWYFSVPLLVVGLLPAAFGLYVLVRARRAPSRWIGLHQKGLVYQSGAQAPVTLAWSEIDSVSRSETAVYVNGSYQHTDYTTIVRGAGQTVSLNNAFGAVVELSKEIEAHSGKQIRPRLASAIERGYEADFGLLGLTSEGVMSQGQLLPWSRVGGLRVREGQLLITEAGQREPWAALPASGFPNLAVFLALSHSLRTTKRG